MLHFLNNVIPEHAALHRKPANNFFYDLHRTPCECILNR
jgi:hypothetical protein